MACDVWHVCCVELIKAMNIHDIEPEYNPVLEGRERYLHGLHDLATAPFKYEEELQAHLERASKQDHILEESRKAKEALGGADLVPLPIGVQEERTLEPARRSKSSGSARTGGEGGAGAGADSVRAMLPAKWTFVQSPGSLPHLPAPGTVDGSLPTPIARATHGACEGGAHLFANMRAAGAYKQSLVGTRIDPATGNPTDYSRIGIGGDGVNQNSGEASSHSTLLSSLISCVSYPSLVFFSPCSFASLVCDFRAIRGSRGSVPNNEQRLLPALRSCRQRGSPGAHPGEATRQVRRTGGRGGARAAAQGQDGAEQGQPRGDG